MNPASLLREHWGLGDPKLTILDGGMNSRTWLVDHGGRTFVAKQVAPEELPHLTAGCEAAALLADAGLITGPPVPTTTGKLVLSEPPLALLEHVPGRELDGGTPEQQRRIADVLGSVHRTARPTPELPTAGFFAWLRPDAPGLAPHSWLPGGVRDARSAVDELGLTWSLLHTDPAPEAFLHDDSTDRTGLIDWMGACRGPVLYDVASAVMYLGGPEHAADFLAAYRAHGVLPPDEWQHLDAFRRFRWAVQAAYFAGRLDRVDLTGVDGQADNEKGLEDARRGLDRIARP